MRFDRCKGTVRVGRLLVTTNVRQPSGSPWVDGCTTKLSHDDGREEWFGGVALLLPKTAKAVSVGWLGAHAPNTYRWRLRAIRGWVRWVLAGRPAPVPLTTGVDFCAESTPGAATPEGERP